MCIDIDAGPSVPWAVTAIPRVTMQAIMACTAEAGAAMVVELSSTELESSEEEVEEGVTSGIVTSVASKKIQW